MATVKIGHASSSQKPQNEQVVIRNYYSSLKPTVILRPLSPELAEKSAKACEAGCNNNFIGYSQDTRYTLISKAIAANYDLSKITAACWADCSAFMTVCAICGGANLKTNYMPSCVYMRETFVKSGDYKAITATEYLSGTDYLKRGDILVREVAGDDGGRHTVMVLSNGAKVNSEVASNAAATPNTTTNNSSLTEDNTQVSITQPATPPIDSTPTSGSTIESVASQDVIVIKVKTEILNVKKDSINLRASLVRIKEGVEELIKNYSEYSAYRYKYTLESMTNSRDKHSKEASKLSENPVPITLDGLAASTFYRLNLTVYATGDNVEYSIPGLIISTAQDSKENFPSVKFGEELGSNRINKVYVKDGSSFKQAIIHIR